MRHFVPSSEQESAVSFSHTEHWCPSCGLQQTLTSLAVNAMLLLMKP